MKSLHRPDLLGWSRFDEKRNVDFCGVAWIRPGGNVLIDPLPMTEHDRAHLEALGGATLIIITNSDHTRGAQGLAQRASRHAVRTARRTRQLPVSVRALARRWG